MAAGRGGRMRARVGNKMFLIGKQTGTVFFSLSSSFLLSLFVEREITLKWKKMMTKASCANTPPRRFLHDFFASIKNGQCSLFVWTKRKEKKQARPLKARAHSLFFHFQERAPSTKEERDGIKTKQKTHTRAS